MSLIDKERETEAWQIICEHVLQLDNESVIEHVDLATLLTSPIHEKLAGWFLHYRRAKLKYQFVNPDQLFSLVDYTDGLEGDIDEVAGIYIFVRLVNQDVMKVGQAKNLRERITRGHLWYGNQNPESNLIDYCKARGCWPNYINYQEIAALLFSMHNTSEEERCFIEFGLHKLLLPEMK